MIQHASDKTIELKMRSDPFEQGVIGSGVAFFLQAWCISLKGPLFAAMFYPLCTVIVTILAPVFLDETIYTGRYSLPKISNYLLRDEVACMKHFLWEWFFPHGKLKIIENESRKHELFCVLTLFAKKKKKKKVRKRVSLK